MKHKRIEPWFLCDNFSKTRLSKPPVTFEEARTEDFVTPSSPINGPPKGSVEELVILRTPADNMEDSVFIIIRLQGNIGGPSSSLAVTEAGERLIAWSHLSYWLFWMKYGLIGCRPLPLANIDFHSLFQLSVPLCCCLPSHFLTVPSLIHRLLHFSSIPAEIYKKKWSPAQDHSTTERQRRGEVSAHSEVTKETSGRRTEHGAEGWSERQRGSERETAVWEGETDGGAEMKWKRDRAGNRGREGGVIIYQVFGCAWQRRKLISTLCVHQLHSQASQGIPLACLCEAGGDTQTLSLYDTPTHTV